MTANLLNSRRASSASMKRFAAAARARRREFSRRNILPPSDRPHPRAAPTSLCAENQDEARRDPHASTPSSAQSPSGAIDHLSAATPFAAAPAPTGLVEKISQT